jgi:hypothetical protein
MNENKKIICKKCSVEKPSECFWWLWKSKGLRRKTCVDCSRSSVTLDENGNKECRKCGEVKSPNSFKPNSHQCIDCVLAHVRERRSKLEHKITVESRVCKRCSVDKPARQYRPSKESVGGIRRICRDCEGIPLKKGHPMDEPNYCSPVTSDTFTV